MRRGFFKCAALSLTLATVLFTGNIAAYAVSGYAQMKTDVGSTVVTAEVGFDGMRGYATVTASDYVDVRMKGIISYYDSGDNLKNYEYIGGFDQRTYGGMSMPCEYEVVAAGCDFNVSSEDGSWSRFFYAN